MRVAEGFDQDCAGVSTHRAGIGLRIVCALNNLALAIGVTAASRESVRILALARFPPQPPTGGFGSSPGQSRHDQSGCDCQFANAHVVEDRCTEGLRHESFDIGGWNAQGSIPAFALVALQCRLRYISKRQRLDPLLAQDGLIRLPPSS